MPWINNMQNSRGFLFDKWTSESLGIDFPWGCFFESLDAAEEVNHSLLIFHLDAPSLINTQELIKCIFVAPKNIVSPGRTEWLEETQSLESM